MINQTTVPVSECVVITGLGGKAGTSIISCMYLLCSAQSSCCVVDGLSAMAAVVFNHHMQQVQPNCPFYTIFLCQFVV